MPRIPSLPAQKISHQPRQACDSTPSGQLLCSREIGQVPGQLSRRIPHVRVARYKSGDSHAPPGFELNGLPIGHRLRLWYETTP